MLRLDDIRDDWETLGRKDPLWAVLTEPDKTGNRWDLADFLETGRQEVQEMIGRLGEIDVLHGRGRALDFGCGVGRLSQALCEHFDEVTGVDIAPSMIAAAEQFNRHGSRCLYLVNQTDDLSIVGNEQFDLVLSRIVLQHIGSELSKRYIREFFRVLRRGGLAVFQLPSHRARPTAWHRISRLLHPSAYRAAIEVSEAPEVISPGSLCQIKVRIRNESSIAWQACPKTCRIRLGNHWLDSRGRMLIRDDGRAELTNDLRPLEGVEIPLTVKAPQVTGAYLLELDMVQEDVSWFGDRGSRTLRLPVEVTEAKRPHPANSGDVANCDLARHIWMGGVPKKEVLREIRNCGARVLAVDEDDSAAAWVSYTYYAVR